MIYKKKREAAAKGPKQGPYQEHEQAKAQPPPRIPHQAN